MWWEMSFAVQMLKKAREALNNRADLQAKIGDIAVAVPVQPTFRMSAPVLMTLRDVLNSTHGIGVGDTSAKEMQYRIGKLRKGKITIYRAYDDNRFEYLGAENTAATLEYAAANDPSLLDLNVNVIEVIRV